jgi:hypothetical protein
MRSALLKSIRQVQPKKLEPKATQTTQQRALAIAQGLADLSGQCRSLLVCASGTCRQIDVCPTVKGESNA